MSIAETRLHQLFDKYGRQAMLVGFTHLLAKSETLSRAAVAMLPDGVYSADD